MKYTEHIPSPPLHLFVEKIWYCSADEFNNASLTIPLPFHELVFNFSESYKIRKAGNNNFEAENPSAWVNGLQSTAYYSYSTRKHEMLGVLFKVNGLKAFVKYHVSEFTDKFIDANFVFGKSVSSLGQRLQEINGVSQKIALVEKFLLSKLLVYNPVSYLSVTLNKLSENIGSKGNIAHLCRDVAVTNKTLIDTFNNHVGLSPLRFSHLQAINKAAHLLSTHPQQSLTKLAYALNFYDQSHFISLFKSITSLTPSAYANFAANKKVDYTSSNFISVEG